MYAKTLAALTLAISFPSLAADGTASGTIVYKGKTVAIKHVWLVRGPDSIDPKLTIRELIFSAVDIGAKVKACKKMTCLGSDVDEGLTVKLDIGPRLNYWMVLDGQRTQYSGTAKPETLNATANTPERLAGKLSIDDTKAGGGKIEIDFDTPLTAELKTAR